MPQSLTFLFLCFLSKSLSFSLFVSFFFCNSCEESVQCWLPSYSTRTTPPPKKNPPHITQHTSTCMCTAIMPTCRKERIVNRSSFQDTLHCAGTACGNDKEELSICCCTAHSPQQALNTVHLSHLCVPRMSPSLPLFPFPSCPLLSLLPFSFSQVWLLALSQRGH